MFACQAGEGIGIVEQESVLYVFFSLPSAFVGLAFLEGVAYDGIGDDGQVGNRDNAFGYHEALVVATGLDSVGAEWYGDDGIDAIEEITMYAF